MITTHNVYNQWRSVHTMNIFEIICGVILVLAAIVALSLPERQRNARHKNDS